MVNELKPEFLVPTGLVPRTSIAVPDTRNDGIASVDGFYGSFNSRLTDNQLSDYQIQVKAGTTIIFDPTKLEGKKHNHYFKDVSNLNTIDVYRVIELFGVTDPCIQHAIKKLLVAGNRGSKNIDKDIQETIDTLLRYQAMVEENKKL